MPDSELVVVGGEVAAGITEGIPKALEFQTQGDFAPGRKPDHDRYKFGWEVAKAIGWTNPD
jgi:hypothetical protein